MVTIPARRSIFTSRRIFPYRNFVPNPELGPSPGWLPIEGDENTWNKVLKDEGYWTVQVSDNPHLAFTKAYEPFRKTWDHWRTIVGQSGFYRDPETVSIELVEKWVPPFMRDERYMPGMRKYLANTGRGEDEEETCAARVYKDAAGALEKAQRRQPFAMVVDCFDPHEPWSPPREYIDLYSDPDYTGQEIGVTNYGFASELHPRAVPPPARDLRGRGHDDRPLARALHGPLLRARPRREHRDRAALRPRLPARRARLHRQGALAAPPRARAGADDPRDARQQGRGRGHAVLRLHPRRRPDRAVDARARPAGLDGGHEPVRRSWTARTRPSSARSTTAACTTASSSAPTTTC